jgi:hypothetical protein
VIGFVGENFSHTRFRGYRAEEGDRVLGWSPGQARAHTSEVGVGVGRVRPGAVSCGRLPRLCFASRCEDGDGWLGCTVQLGRVLSAGPCRRGCWLLGRAWPPAGFRPTVSFVI